MKQNAVLEVPGFVAGAVEAGVKYQGRKDLALIYSKVPACVAGVFTTNRVKAAPVLLDAERIRSGQAQAIVANSGNANACTGPQGMKDAHSMSRAAAAVLGIDEDLVLVASTGVIGLPMNMTAIEKALPALHKNLEPEGFHAVAKAMMTTDTFAKIASKKITVHEKTFTVTAVAKGAGMIRPDMATMLCFVCTDMGAKPGLLKAILKEAVDDSFNAITVDGDTSTNDTVLLLANGLSGLHLEDAVCAKAFQEALKDILTRLALDMVQDGEGATKLVAVKVTGAPSREDARKVAYTVSESPLVKTAFFGQDANWGRIIAAVGRSGVSVQPDAIQIYFDQVHMVKDGQGCGPDAEKAATKVLQSDRFMVTIELGMGSGEATVHTCDLSEAYIKINADYRT
jgi:glutamate N-acetyltransferase/amino-acid N-acetyltransferase